MNMNLSSALLVFAAAAPAVVTDAPAGAQAQSAPCESPVPETSPSGCNSDGIVRPPVTGDQGGVITPPDSTRSMPMPVIPPPGSPGGNPSVQPK